MKSTAHLFLISLIAYLTLIICSCAPATDLREPLKLSGPLKATNITVTNITCQPCTVKIQSALLRTKGVQSATATLDKVDNVMVTYFEEYITKLEIKKILQDMGYMVSAVKDE